MKQLDAQKYVNIHLYIYSFISILQYELFLFIISLCNDESLAVIPPSFWKWCYIHSGFYVNNTWKSKGKDSKVIAS